MACPGAVDDAINGQERGRRRPSGAPTHADAAVISLAADQSAGMYLQAAAATKLIELCCGFGWQPVAMNVPERAQVSQKATSLFQSEPLPEERSALAHAIERLAPVSAARLHLFHHRSNQAIEPQHRDTRCVP